MARKQKVDNILDSEIIAVAGEWPKVEIGTHLTVTKYENGITILKWDDEALEREVREAIAKAESVIPVSETKPTKGKKKNGKTN